ncbi:MAG: hypothetical protein QOI21_5558 [Actinomycetota bacterium]|jgi:uncharacterized protein (TIGR03086 family)|nr:hypothetical protein [Actinomycetota bacterium]
MDTRELDRHTLAVLDKIVSSVTEADLGRETPCEGWDLGDLLRHQVAENNAFAIALREGSAPDWNDGDLGRDPYRAYADSVDAAVAAFAEEGVLERLVTIREFGTFPGSFAALMHLVDSVAHGWDLAKTLNLPYEPGEDAVAVALAFAEKIPADPGDRTTRGSFDVVIEVPAGASPLDRFLGLTGRDPGWAPSIR